MLSHTPAVATTRCFNCDVVIIASRIGIVSILIRMHEYLQKHHATPRMLIPCVKHFTTAQQEEEVGLMSKSVIIACMPLQ